MEKVVSDSRGEYSRSSFLGAFLGTGERGFLICREVFPLDFPSP